MGSGAQSTFCPMDAGALARGVKRLGRQVNHSPLSSAKVKNMYSSTPSPPCCCMVWTRKTAFIYVFKNVPLHLQAFFCLDPINVCKNISICEVIFLLFAFVAVLGREGVSRHKTPIQNITLTGNIGSKHDGSLCNLVLPKPIRPQTRKPPQLTCWQPLRDMHSARELPADSRDCASMQSDYPRAARQHEFAPRHGRHQWTCSAPLHNLRRFSSDTP